MKKYFFLLSLLWEVAACTVSNKNDINKDVKAYLADFNSKLSQSDEVIWKQFMTLQNKEEIFKIIRILQNKESKIVSAKIGYDEATSKWEEGFLKVDIPVTLLANNSQNENTHLLLNLLRKNGRFYTARVEGENLYQKFSVLKNMTEFADELKKRLADLKVFYNEAKEIQKDYDSVIWFVNHNYKAYYYAVNGQYNFDSLKKQATQNFKMGLVDAKGKVIVPVEFDVVGNPSLLLASTIEVRKNGKVGYYSMEGKEIIPAIYDWLVPFDDKQTIALVKRDSTYGWLDKDYGFHRDFPSNEAKQSIEQFKYLTSTKLTLGRGFQDMINILYPMREGMLEANGLVVSSAYYVKNGILPLINDGFITTPGYEDGKFLQFGNAFEENTNDKPFSISESLVALVSNFTTRYIGGRGEFYGSHQITLFDKKASVVSKVLAGGDEDFRFRKINDKLFESRAIYNSEGMGPYGPAEYNVPSYQYFEFDSGKLSPLGSHRLYQCSEFVKLDSSYLSGKFLKWNPMTQKSDTTLFLSVPTITEMRDEILASYGFIFPDEGRTQMFTDAGQWYKPTIESYEEIYSKASEVDKHNLDFLNRLIGSTPSSKSL